MNFLLAFLVLAGMSVFAQPRGYYGQTCDEKAIGHYLEISKQSGHQRAVWLLNNQGWLSVVDTDMAYVEASLTSMINALSKYFLPSQYAKKALENSGSRNAAEMIPGDVLPKVAFPVAEGCEPYLGRGRSHRFGPDMEGVKSKEQKECLCDIGYIIENADREARLFAPSPAYIRKCKEQPWLCT